MKKFVKRILCGALFLLTISSAMTAQSLRRQGDSASVAAVADEKISTEYSAETDFSIAGDTLVKYNGTDAEVVIPADKGILHIGEGAFKDNDTMTKVVLPETILSIGASAFENCSRLTENVTIYAAEIGDRAFAECVLLQGVTLRSPKSGSVEFEVGAEAFRNCGTELTKRFTFTFSGERVVSLGDKAFAGSALGDLAVTNGLRRIGSEVFAGSSLSYFVFSDEIDLDALEVTGTPFSGVELKIVVNSMKYTSKDGGIFNASKTKLYFVSSSAKGEFTLPNVVSSVKEYAFYGSRLQKVTLNANLVTLGKNVFANSSITEIDFGEAKLKEIPDYAFSGSKLRSVRLPNTVTKLGVGAFENSALTSFEADNLREIGDRAFAECKSLREIELTDSAEKMGAAVFENCTALETVVLPSVKELGDGTFVGAKKLQEVRFGASASITGAWTFKGTPIKAVTLGENVTEIGNGAFYGATALTELELPESVRTIGEYAFAECKKLKQVNGIERAERFCAYAFYNAGLSELNLESATVVEKAAFAIVPKEGEAFVSYSSLLMPCVVSIGDYAFFNGDMELVKIPSTIREIGEGAFASARKLATLRAEQNDYYFAEEDVLYRYLDGGTDAYELVCYPAARVQPIKNKIRSYEVKRGTERIAAYAFYDLNNGVLTRVVFPYSVSEIGDRAFYASGITRYRFECIQAPTLEAVYRESVAERFAQEMTEGAVAFYKEFSHANFETELCNYSEYGYSASALVLEYPDNGVGYDEGAYALYFGSQSTIGVLLTESGNRCVDALDKLPSVEEISAWLQAEVNTENKRAFSELADAVKTARSYYDSIKWDKAQLKLFPSESKQKLLDSEKALRAVKAYFGMPVQRVGLSISEDSEHKSSYMEGGVFDKTYLVVMVVYDDLSTEVVSRSDWTLLTVERLTTSDTFVRVEYDGLYLDIPITVTAQTNRIDPPTTSATPSVSPVKKRIIQVVALLVTAVAAVILVAWLIVAWKHRKPVRLFEQGEEYEDDSNENEHESKNENENEHEHEHEKKV